tara:strand:+ start:2635 stop:2868 length:234 start_codon:yes stop_codon:yes gene_type:complete
MKNIEVLGTGCAKCVKTMEMIKAIATDCGAEVQVVKEINPEVMMRYGVMSTPAVVIDKQLVHSGSIPTKDKIIGWLK